MGRQWIVFGGNQLPKDIAEHEDADEEEQAAYQVLLQAGLLS